MAVFLEDTPPSPLHSPASAGLFFWPRAGAAWAGPRQGARTPPKIAPGMRQDQAPANPPGTPGTSSSKIRVAKNDNESIDFHPSEPRPGPPIGSASAATPTPRRPPARRAGRLHLRQACGRRPLEDGRRRTEGRRDGAPRAPEGHLSAKALIPERPTRWPTRKTPAATIGPSSAARRLTAPDRQRAGGPKELADRLAPTRGPSYTPASNGDPR